MLNVSHLKLVTLPLLLVCCNLNNARCNLLDLEHLPEPFNDQMLPVSQRNGRMVNHLGHVLHLNTFMPAKNVTEFNTKFTIYTRHHTPKEIIFQPRGICVPGTCFGPYQYNLNSLASSGFDPKLRTIIMISGFLTGERVKWMQRSKDLWLKLENVNVILVTWSSANRYIYSTAVADTPLVARQITIFLYYLAKLNQIDLFNDADFAKKINFVGHSLGAHVAGFVGQDLSGKLGRITGLDPAGPAFDNQTPEMRLDKSDALLVDIIHTNAGKMHYANAMFAALFMLASKLPGLNKLTNATNENIERSKSDDPFWYGIENPIGHLDFYANNGKSQPGCADPMHLCDHSRAHDIYEKILAYELDLRTYKSTRGKQRLTNRLLAFSSDDFESFELGENLVRGECAAQSDYGESLQSPGSNYDTQNMINENEGKACVVPMDYLAPVEDFRRELSEKFAVNFEKSQRFYFKTRGEEPLLGDHYLLKLYLDKGRTLWSRDCSLDVEITVESTNGRFSSSIKLTNSTKLVENEQFYGLALPFVHPRGPGARDALNNLIEYSRSSDPPQNKMQLQEVAPSVIDLRISEPEKPLKFGEEIKMKLANLLGMKKVKPSRSSECSLSINSISIAPVGSTLEFVYGQKAIVQDNLLLLSPEKSQYRSKESYELSAVGDNFLSIVLDGIIM